MRALTIDRQAKKDAAAKKAEEAMSAYYKILESDPELPEVHSNIGVLFLQNKKNEEATKSLLQALKLAVDHKDLAAQFHAHYNLGVLYGAEKKIPEALEQYQAALEILPTSKETKHNIELLIQSGSDDSKDGENKDSDKKDKDGKSDDKSKDGKDQKDQKDKDKDKDKDKEQDKKDKDKDDKDKKDGKDEKDKKPPDAKGSPKYKPRPFQGDQLSEGDVKKIFGDFKNQEQKIRANFEKKERKENKNEKDW